MTNNDDENISLFYDLTPKQNRIVSGMGDIFDNGGEHKITYSHSTMCQTSLPFKASEAREWKNKNGNSVVLIEAGQVYDPKINDMVKLGLPYGTKPRLILLDWNRQAILTQSPTIEVENTLYGFLKRLKLPTEGRVYSMAKKQLAALAACQMSVGRTEADGSGTTGYGRIVNEMNVLFSKDVNQRVLWPNTVELSGEYFNSLMVHAVPLNEDALLLLKDSALELDVYAMLAERLHRIPYNKPQFIGWAQLHEQYGSGYKRIRRFRERFLEHLLNVKAAYHDANIEEVTSSRGMPKGLKLYCSRPPVRKLMVQNTGLTVDKPVDS